MESAVAGHLVWCCTDCGALYRSDFPRCPNDGAEVIASSRDPLVGTTVDNYVIEDLIGEGAMGRVYRAHHRHLHDRRYALKVLIGDLAVTAANRIRFAKEAESASRLSHPNVVGVYDVGRSAKGLLYIAMELVDGESASALLDRGPVEVSRVLAIARGVAAGLAHAHAAGIVHRDLKPDNILIVDGDIPRIVDFGLAISTDRSDTRLTTTGMTMGTPAYIAPEQASGKGVDHRADLYALGVSMFEMLTQLLPFDAGDPVEMVTAKVTRSAPSLEQRAPHIRVPAAVSRLIAKLLERYPEDRFDSAEEVLVELERCQAPRKSRRTLVAMIAGVVVAAGAAGAWALTANRSSAPDVVATPPAVVASAAKVALAPPPESPPVAEAPVPGGGAGPPPSIPGPQVAESPPVVARPPRAGLPAKTLAKTASPPTKDRAHHHRDKPAKTPPAAAPSEPVTVSPIIEPPKVSIPIEPPPAPPPTFTAHIAHFDVAGSFSSAIVSHALDRVAPAISACHASTEQTVIVRFLIGESRRAESITPSRESSCVVAAIAGLRTETAPDLGDVSVSVKVVFH